MKYTHNDYYGYINKIQQKAISNPAWFWSDSASKERQWLHDNGASKIVDEIYENTPEDIRKNIDSKKLSSAVRTQRGMQRVKDNIYNTQKQFLDTAGAVGATTLPLIAAAPAVVAAPGAVIGGAVAGALGAEGTNALVRRFSNGKYSNWGDFITGGKNRGETVGTLADFTNPGAIVAGIGAGKVGHILDRHYIPKFDFNIDSAYRITNKTGFEDAKQNGVIKSGPTSSYPHFTKGRSFGRVHNGDYLIETKPEVALGRYDSHLQPEKLFTSSSLDIGESVTPITKRNVPINVSANRVNIYKKTPFGYWKKYINGIDGYGTPNYGNIQFIRNVGNIPSVKNGKIYLSPEENALVNMAYDQSFITHKNYRNRPGEDYIVINPKAFSGRKFLSIEPMDTFLENNPIDVKDVTILSGNPSKINLAKRSGFNVIEDNDLINKYNEIISNIKENKIGGIKITKDGFGYQVGVPEYDRLANKIIKKHFGEVDYPSVKALENSTGLNAGVSPDKFGGIYDWNKFIESSKTAKLKDIGNLKFTYPNGRVVLPLHINKETSPSNILSEKLFYDPTTHAEFDIIGTSKPTREEFNDPIMQRRISKVNSFPLL